MEYCSIDQVKSRYPESFLIEITSTDNSIDETVLNQAIKDASREIDSFASGINISESSETPDFIERLCIEITINILLRRIEQSDDEEFRSRQEWIDKRLELLSKNKLDFPQKEVETEKTTQFDSDDPRGW